MQMGYDFDDARPRGESSARAAVPVAPARPGAAPDGAEPGPPDWTKAASPDWTKAASPDWAIAASPDWAGLRARFLALHALRRALPQEPVAVAPAGGFVALSESVLSDCRADGAVNPVYWANRKGDSAITIPVVASPTRGDRGMA